MRSSSGRVALALATAAALGASFPEQSRRRKRTKAKRLSTRRPNPPGTLKVTKLMRRAMPFAFSVAERRKLS